MADKKDKKYVSDNAQLMTEWHWEKNNALGFDPRRLTCGSGKTVWWKCAQGHEWEAIISSRSKGKDAPIVPEGSQSREKMIYKQLIPA